VWVKVGLGGERSLQDGKADLLESAGGGRPRRAGGPLSRCAVWLMFGRGTGALSGRGAERERPQAPERRGERLGPGPGPGKAQARPPARAHDPPGRVEQAVAQALGLGS
jgi:hypothetical protein